MKLSPISDGFPTIQTIFRFQSRACTDFSLQNIIKKNPLQVKMIEKNYDKYWINNRMKFPKKD